MKSLTWSYSLLVSLIFVVTGVSCTRDELLKLPSVSTATLKQINSTSVLAGGTVSSDGGSYVTARGICWGENQDPTLTNNYTTDGDGIGYFESTLSGLSGGTVYYIRSYATNSQGTAYGNQYLFVTPLTDVDGNVYATITIGGQTWMAQNLMTTKFNNNTDIGLVSSSSVWSQLDRPAYCWYKNDKSTNMQVYGALYNWYAVNTDRLCPVGWHVPSEKEWLILSETLGGELICSGQLKESGVSHWQEPNEGATNNSSFTALPGGYRTGLSSGSFRTRTYFGWWWASTEYDETGARARLMTYDSKELMRGTALKRNGYSVRCVKDYHVEN